MKETPPSANAFRRHLQMRFAAIIRGNERGDESGAENLGDEGLKTCPVYPPLHLGLKTQYPKGSKSRCHSK